MEYAIYNAATGLVRSNGVCPDGFEHLSAMEGEAVFFGDADPGDRIVDGVRVPVVRSPGHDYIERRIMSYPSVENQLDALWHAMDRGELPKVAAFYDPIARVKADIPKPNIDLGTL